MRPAGSRAFTSAPASASFRTDRGSLIPPNTPAGGARNRKAGFIASRSATLNNRSAQPAAFAFTAPARREHPGDPLRVRPAVQEQANDGLVPGLGGVPQRARRAAVRRDRHRRVRPVVEQELDHRVRRAAGGRGEQRRPPVVGLGVRVGAGPEEQPRLVRVIDGPHEGRRPGLVAGVRVGPCLQQEPDGLGVAVQDRVHQRGRAAVALSLAAAGSSASSLRNPARSPSRNRLHQPRRGRVGGRGRGLAGQRRPATPPPGRSTP